MKLDRTGLRALVVDDDSAVLNLHARALSSAGYQVTTASSGAQAAQVLTTASFDVVFSDIDMPGMDGIALLERVRLRDPDVPVVLITGNPSVDTAIRAMEYGALRYLVKPASIDALIEVADYACRLHRLARAKRTALQLSGGVDQFIGDLAGLVASFNRALASIKIAYQPIVSWSAKKVYAYEALLRSSEPTLPDPGALLTAAEQLGRIHELGRVIRARAIEPLARLPDDALLFVNLHPSDLLDSELFATTGPFAAAARRIVLEITERASLHHIRDVPARIASLRALGYRIAIDDLGAGHAGLTSFALLEPDIVKLDMALIRDLHLGHTKQTLVRTMITMCKELNIVVTSEGIECGEERDALAHAGCDLMQGYLFARPGEAFPVSSY